MWDVFLAAWAEGKQKRQKEREKEKERRKEDWNKRRTVWGGYDEFWFQRAHPPVALPQRLSSGWRWVMCDGFLFSRAQRAADLSKAAAEYILQRRHRKRNSSGFHPLCASSKGRFRASRRASHMKSAPTHCLICGTSFGQKRFVRRLSQCSQKQDGSDALVFSTLPNFSHFGSNQSRENIVLWRFLGLNWLFRSHTCHLQLSTVLLSSSHACMVLSSTCDFSFLSVSPLTPDPAVHDALIGPSESSLLCSALIIFSLFFIG